MQLPVMNLGLLTIALILLLLWPTFPELLSCLSFSTISVASIPGRLLYMLNDLPGKTYGLLSVGESLMRSLTSDDGPPFSMVGLPGASLSLFGSNFLY
ncbi:hypothetical protein DSO57_1028282 [Entomophthora muscae]|uniref:Uncharacterized protein n=1 Tax=Entomophthora muscae TaxID=34485 RepID=A0ACC2RSF8_9FUNG|nr:hypothetical protein DSO57_1028282 [Entomophthora muscae]